MPDYSAMLQIAINEARQGLEGGVPIGAAIDNIGIGLAIGIAMSLINK